MEKYFIADLLGGQQLLEVLQTSFIFKNYEKVVKSGCFENRLQCIAPIFFQNEGGIWSLLSENIDVLLNY